jgi:AcrR family transcriptional regulator
MELRTYKSPRRALAAGATRRAILDSALDLFRSVGYGAASMSEIAAKAEVSLNTVYTSVGKKPQLLIALIQDASMDERISETMTAVSAADSPERIVALLAHGTRDVFARNDWVLGSLYDNAATDPQIAAVTEEATARYLSRIRQAAERLDSFTALAPGIDVDRATGILWFYFGYRPWRDLRDLGWTWDDAEAWLTRRAVEGVLNPARA